ncbi:MAG: PDZ domain-containing protein [Chloroflexi bacterium]|nr:PDZ domain-containing protein [Chloroflexota bacterium]
MEGEESKSITKPLGSLPEPLPASLSESLPENFDTGSETALSILSAEYLSIDPDENGYPQDSDYPEGYPHAGEIAGEGEDQAIQQPTRQFVFNLPALITMLLLMLAIGFTGGALLGSFGGYYLATSRGLVPRLGQAETRTNVPLQIAPAPEQGQGAERQFIIPLPLAPGQSGPPPGSVLPPGIAPGQVIPGPGVVPGSGGTAPGTNRPYLGVRYDQLSPQIAETMHLSVSQGALVRSVDPGSPAARAGIETGDIIIAVNDQPVDLNHPLFLELLKYQPGENLTITFRKGSEDFTKTLKLEAAPAPQPPQQPQQQPRQRLPRS